MNVNAELDASGFALGFGLVEGGSQHGADFVGLLVQLGSADFHHPTVGGGIHGERDPRSFVQAGLSRAYGGQDVGDVLFPTAGEECTPLQIHRRL